MVGLGYCRLCFMLLQCKRTEMLGAHQKLVQLSVLYNGSENLLWYCVCMYDSRARCRLLCTAIRKGIVLDLVCKKTLPREKHSLLGLAWSCSPPPPRKTLSSWCNHGSHGDIATDSSHHGGAAASCTANLQSEAPLWPARLLSTTQRPPWMANPTCFIIPAAAAPQHTKQYKDRPFSPVHAWSCFQPTQDPKKKQFSRGNAFRHRHTARKY